MEHQGVVKLVNDEAAAQALMDRVGVADTPEAQQWVLVVSFIVKDDALPNKVRPAALWAEPEMLELPLYPSWRRLRERWFLFFFAFILSLFPFPFLDRSVPPPPSHSNTRTPLTLSRSFFRKRQVEELQSLLEDAAELVDALSPPEVSIQVEVRVRDDAETGKRLLEIVTSAKQPPGTDDAQLQMVCLFCCWYFFGGGWVV